MPGLLVPPSCRPRYVALGDRKSLGKVDLPPHLELRRDDSHSAHSNVRHALLKQESRRQCSPSGSRSERGLPLFRGEIWPRDTHLLFSWSSPLCTQSDGSWGGLPVLPKSCLGASKTEMHTGVYMCPWACKCDYHRVTPS